MSSTTKSPRLTRKNSQKETERRKISSNNIKPPADGLSEQQLQSLECHFNWNLSNFSKSTLCERINAVEGHIKENGFNVLP